MPYAERIIGSIRRECLDHIIIFNERHLHRVVSSYVDYYHRSRTHLALDKDCPHERPIQPVATVNSIRSIGQNHPNKDWNMLSVRIQAAKLVRKASPSSASTD